MTPVEQDSHPIEAGMPWAERLGVWWYTPERQVDVREVAQAMNALGARFVTITAYELPKQEGFRLEYHWDIAGRLLGFAPAFPGASVDSIYDLCEAADWIEREVHEEFGIDFIGREYEPLLLRAGNPVGVNLREGVAASEREEVAR